MLVVTYLVPLRLGPLTACGNKGATMAELHPNQIPYQADRTAKANLVGPQDYLSEPLARLGSLADGVAKKISDDNNSKIKDNVLLAEAKIKENIAKAKATQIEDYDRLIQESYELYNRAFDGFPESAVRRFNAENPTLFEALQLSVNDQVFNKKKEQILQEALDDIPRLTSNAALGLYGKDGRGYVVEKLRNQLKDYLSVAEMDEVLNKVHSELDNYEISQLIAEHDWSGARAYLNDPMRHTTIRPTDMVRYMERIAAGETADLKEKEEKKKKEEDPRAIYLKNAVARLAQQSTPQSPKDDEISLFIALAKKGVVKLQDGSLMDTRDVSPSEWLDWVNAAEKYAKDTGTKTASDGMLLRNFDYAYDRIFAGQDDEDLKKNIRDIDMTKITELEGYLQHPAIYDSNNSEIQKQYNKARDIIERADKIDYVSSWAYATELGQDKINRYRSYSGYITKQDDTPGKVFVDAYINADNGLYLDKDDLKQLMSNVMDDKLKTLEQQGYKPKINSVARFVVAMSSLLENEQALMPDEFAKRYGLDNVTEQRQSETYRRFMTGIITRGLFDDIIETNTDGVATAKGEEDARQIVVAYLNMMRGYELTDATENQKRQPLMLAHFLLGGQVEGTYQPVRWYNLPEANSYEDVSDYKPINIYNKGIKR